MPVSQAISNIDFPAQFLLRAWSGPTSLRGALSRCAPGGHDAAPHSHEKALAPRIIAITALRDGSVPKPGGCEGDFIIMVSGD